MSSSGEVLMLPHPHSRAPPPLSPPLDVLPPTHRGCHGRPVLPAPSAPPRDGGGAQAGCGPCRGGQPRNHTPRCCWCKQYWSWSRNHCRLAPGLRLSPEPLCVPRGALRAEPPRPGGRAGQAGAAGEDAHRGRKRRRRREEGRGWEGGGGWRGGRRHRGSDRHGGAGSGGLPCSWGGGGPGGAGSGGLPCSGGGG